MSNNEKYLKKITSQHRTKPNLMKWAAELLAPSSSLAKLLKDFDDEFDVYKADGAQQNVVGELVGRARTLNWQPADGSNPRLEDDLYRVVQLAKISINQWDGTIPSVVELWKSLFPEYQIIIEDNQDMTMNLSIIGLTSAFEKELMGKGYIAPKPSGVRIVYRFYDHLYRIDKSAFFMGTVAFCSIYNIDSKAKLAEDTTVYAEYRHGASASSALHYSINSKYRPTDGMSQVSGGFGTAVISSGHLSADARLEAKDQAATLEQYNSTAISGFQHYIIKE